MKHIKRFNESAFEATDKFTSLGRIREFEEEINNSLFTPKTEQLPLKSLYKAIVIKTLDPISTEFLTNYAGGSPRVYNTNWILLEFKSGKFGISFYPGENYIKDWSDRNGFNYEDHLIIGYNDINHAEIENILSDYGVVIDEIWGIPV